MIKIDQSNLKSKLYDYKGIPFILTGLWSNLIQQVTTLSSDELKSLLYKLTIDGPGDHVSDQIVESMMSEGYDIMDKSSIEWKLSVDLITELIKVNAEKEEILNEVLILEVVDELKRLFGCDSMILTDYCSILHGRVKYAISSDCIKLNVKVQRCIRNLLLTETSQWSKIDSVEFLSKLNSKSILNRIDFLENHEVVVY